MRISPLLFLLLTCFTPAVLAQDKRIVTIDSRVVIAASTVFDGKGHVFHNTRIVVEGSRIVAIDPKAGPVDYDLRGHNYSKPWLADRRATPRSNS